MSRIIKQVRVVKTVTRALGSGAQESFWEVQEKRCLRWKTVAVFGKASDAFNDAMARASL